MRSSEANFYVALLKKKEKKQNRKPGDGKQKQSSVQWEAGRKRGGKRGENQKRGEEAQSRGG